MLKMHAAAASVVLLAGLQACLHAADVSSCRVVIGMWQHVQSHLLGMA